MRCFTFLTDTAFCFFASRPGGADNQPTEPKFEPYKGKIRKPGTDYGDEKGDCGNQGGREGNE